ncbi:MAG: SH3 domain-containing protein, partial [Candidatus Sungiibacteriota bacterium]
GYLAFCTLAVIWIFQKKKAGEKISLRAKIIIAVLVLSGPNILLTMTQLSPAPETSVSGSNTLYVKTGSANVRECPSTSCKIIDSLPQNQKLTFPGNLYDKYPEWAEITFPNGQIGYVSKTTLSENPVSERQLTPTDDSSSIGGITIGPWNNIQTTVGESYEIPFCEPPSAISGATCGALADTTTDPKGGTPPYSFIKKSGFLPPGMALELNGTLRGSPTQEGTYNFRLCAKDLYGGEGCQNLAVVVKKEELPTVAAPTPSPSVSPTPQPITESVKEQIKISSYTCTLDQIMGGYYRYSVSFTGEVTAPVGSRLIESPVTASFSTSGEQDSCGAWTKTYRYGLNCRRDPGQPETTSFSVINAVFNGSKRPFNWPEDKTDRFLNLSKQGYLGINNDFIPGGFHCN